MPWFEQLTLRGVLSAMFNEYGAVYVLAPAGLLFAPASLRKLTLAAVPVAIVLCYVQQPDRALWNFHYLALPLAALPLSRAPTLLAWSTVGAFAVANLRVGAQLESTPPARFALGLSVLLATAALAFAMRGSLPRKRQRGRAAGSLRLSERSDRAAMTGQANDLARMIHKGPGNPERSFGLSVGIVLALIGCLFLWRGRIVAAEVVGTIGVVLLLLGVVRPRLLTWPSAVWWRFARILAYVNARVILTLVFALVLFPISVLWRLIGRDPLARRRATWPGWSQHPARYRNHKHYERMF